MGLMREQKHEERRDGRIWTTTLGIVLQRAWQHASIKPAWVIWKEMMHRARRCGILGTLITGARSQHRTVTQLYNSTLLTSEPSQLSHSSDFIRRLVYVLSSQLRALTSPPTHATFLKQEPPQTCTSRQARGPRTPKDIPRRQECQICFVRFDFLFFASAKCPSQVRVTCVVPGLLASRPNCSP